MGSRAAGLTEDEAAARLAQYGPNQIARERRQSWLQRLYLAARNPLVILLTILAILSFATNDYKAGTVMLLMVGLGLSLRFIQETRADTAAAKLKAMISVTATVMRDGQPREIPLQQLVPGDVSQPVVDVLESVEIEQEQGELLVVPLCADKGLAQPVQEQGTIG